MENTCQLLSVKEVMARTGLGRTTLWRRVRNGEFPAPRQLGPRRTAWIESEVNEHLNNLPHVTWSAAGQKTKEVRPR